MNPVFATKSKLVIFLCLTLTLIFFNPATKAAGSEEKKPGFTPLPYPIPNYGTGEQAKLITRGEYLAKAGDCIACHTDTDHHGTVFAGGLGIKTPFGTFYSPNITPDKETGIGNFTDEQFVRALQHGISPQGYNYFPVFPYTSFTRVTRDDLLAIKAYLFNIPPIHKAPPKNDVPFPFSWRFLQYGWKLLFFEFNKGVYQYNPAKSPLWNRGAYIVEGLGHCGECHTPRNIFGAMKQAYALTGAFVDSYYAPNITAHGLEGVSTQEIVEVFTKHKKVRGGGFVGGPMLEVNVDSLKYMTQYDLNAIATYLKTVKSKQPEVKSSGKIDASTGKDIYTSHCGVCHDTGAAGAPKISDAAAWSVRIKQGMATMLQRAINGYNSMPPRGTCMTCSDAEIKAAIEYIADKSQGQGTGTTQATPPKAPKLTLADGQKLYNETCSVCHAEGKLGAPKVGDKTAWAPLIAQNMDVLIYRAIHGYRRMPPRGTCIDCTDAEIIAAVKYMVQQSQTGADYSLW